MKNIGKFLGIIAILAMIGLAVGCEKEAEPDDQISIIVTNLPNGANTKFAAMALLTEKNPDVAENITAISSAAKTITGNQVETFMNFASGKNVDKAFGEPGNYFVQLKIYAAYPSDDSATPIKSYVTSDKVSILKGPNTVLASKFTPEPIESDFPTSQQPPENKPTANDFGTYKTTYKNSANADITETVVLTETGFEISDNSGGKTGAAADQLKFRIDSWESLTTNIPTGYTGAYKFTGKMISTTQGYIPSDKTAPNFVPSDVNAIGTGPDCWMFIYFKGETGNITFIRSAFSKQGNINSSIITGADGTSRVYTKQ